MSFGQPWVLLALLVPALLVLFVWRRRGGRTALPFDHSAAAHARWLAAAVHAAESLPALALAVAILLWAEPQTLTAPKIQRKLTNIEFCVDISGSMTAEFGAGSRYDASMKAINEFLDYREGDAFGLTFFGNSVLHWVPLTNDVSAFRCAPPFMRPELAPPWFGGTEIGKALLACREVLVSREQGDRMIVLVSDGFSSDLAGDRAQEIARRMIADNIVVYGVHISDGNVPDEIVNITALTGGEVFQPGDQAALDAVFQRIDQMQETELEKGAAEYVDDFWLLCVVGLSLCGAFALSQLLLRVHAVVAAAHGAGEVEAWVWLATAGVTMLVLAGELLHRRRVQRVARLAFGPGARAAAWTWAAPPLRVVAAGLLTWGLAALLTVPAKVHRSDAIADDEFRHLLIVLDVSPSMRLADAGKTGKQSRQGRAKDLLDSLFSRVSVGRYKISVVAVYNGAKPVVIDTLDSEVVRNILTDLPMHYAFRPGKTKLLDGIEEAARVAKPWAAKSTLLLLISDGDTVPATGMPALPASIAEVLVIGVGDPMAGSFIDGRQSRQDVSTLRQIAVRLGGVFHNGNSHHVPTETLRQVTESGGKSLVEQLTLREYALLALLLGSAVLALLPVLLHVAGTRFAPGRPTAPQAPRAVGNSTPKDKPDARLAPARLSAR